MRNFHPLKVVGRGSETQAQLGDNVNYIMYVEHSQCYKPADKISDNCMDQTSSCLTRSLNDIPSRRSWTEGVGQ